ncbi:MAG: hypothetical protein R2703_11355 [Micropruina glycogenica]
MAALMGPRPGVVAEQGWFEFTHEGVDGFLVAVEVGVQGVDAGGEAVRFGAGDPGQGGARWAACASPQ